MELLYMGNIKSIPHLLTEAFFGTDMAVLIHSIEDRLKLVDPKPIFTEEHYYEKDWRHIDKIVVKATFPGEKIVFTADIVPGKVETLKNLEKMLTDMGSFINGFLTRQRELGLEEEKILKINPLYYL